MSEQEKPKSFMQELDKWADAYVIAPAFNATQDDCGIRGKANAIPG